MPTRSLISITKVCTQCEVDESFIRSLHDLGHIVVISENDDHFIEEAQLKSLERMIYFHSELQINLEGIDAIAHLLHKIETLQEELAAAQNYRKEFGVDSL